MNRSVTILSAMAREFRYQVYPIPYAEAQKIKYPPSLIPDDFSVVPDAVTGLARVLLNSLIPDETVDRRRVQLLVAQDRPLTRFEYSDFSKVWDRRH
jgi:hypothetical protein